ncbi:MAG: hypothetical protein LWX56_06665, partial [Ignavibacteria bacterium]|nr:hypothetical protein [Ignavibacteria bacterium]
GVCLVAHPSFLPDTVVQKAIDLGIDGLEIIHPSHSGSQNKKYSDWADKLRLLKSGGSDFHGGMKNDEDNLGKFYIPDTFYISLKNKCTGMKDIRSAE